MTPLIHPDISREASEVVRVAIVLSKSEDIRSVDHLIERIKGKLPGVREDAIREGLSFWADREMVLARAA